MAGNDGVVFVNKNWVRKSKGRYAVGDLSYLSLGVNSCISSVGMEIRDGLIDDAQLRWPSRWTRRSVETFK